MGKNGITGGSVHPSAVVTDAGRRLFVAGGFLDEAEHCLGGTGRDHCLVMIRPGEFPALTAAAAHLLRANFLEKDGVQPESFDRHLAALEPQNFTLVL
jgi:hypothetical protein